jgi:hypothetical protein
LDVATRYNNTMLPFSSALKGAKELALRSLAIRNSQARSGGASRSSSRATKTRARVSCVIGSWSLNSNHDMYSGGYGYFDLLLADPRFERQQGSSVFSLRHPDWNIVGLDTAWDEGVLHGMQVGWLRDQLDDSKRKVMLLSHHPLFSVYDPAGDELANQLEPILQTRPVKAWLWGHEHRCVAYSSHRNVEFGRCVGHGGVPAYMWRGTEDACPSPAIYEDRRCYTKGLERWALFGFVVLDFNGPEIDVRYIDENGQVHRKERIA